jgi:hypothetical protein
MIRLALTPSVRNTARCVALRVEEHFDVADVVGARALEIGPGKVVEILFRNQHGHALVVDVEKVLQITKAVRLPHGFDRGIRQADAVAARQRKHQLRLEAPFDVNVQLAFGQLGNQRVVMH